ncbi:MULTISPECIES: glycosyltransferase family 1 protein [unclassified Methylobacterium]|uniref:glycosyltransferase family 4 protein n=1 Tax=unclassified Methylobacterium TaxID=2615210 RepID=UPI000AD94E1D|nr:MULTISPECIES: glycosyltransferase family 1 protein [unclassified Methylobacterium]
MPKSVMLDGYNLGLEKGTGVATYARNLSYELHELGYRTDVLYGTRASPGIDPLLREISFFDPAVGTPPQWLVILRYIRDQLTSPLGRRAVKVPITGTVISKTFEARMPYFDQIWNSVNLFDVSLSYFKTYNRTLRVSGLRTPDIMHWTYPLPIRIPGAKNIYTLHDLVPLRLPFTTGDIKRRYLRLMRRIVKDADHIVTVSETSRRDIINLLGCPEHRITNTYQSVEIPKKFAEKPEDVVRREIEGAFGLPYKGYFLFFGAIEPKKNVGRLVEAYLASQVSAPLVIVGGAAWKSDVEFKFINPTTNSYLEQIDNMTYQRDRIRRFDYAPFSLLVSLIRGAKGVVFPSLYEGFGLPVLESMLLGTPVITSKEGSTPEVAGDAALLINPYDARDIADAIRAVDSDADLRGRLSEMGKVQAAKYSPEIYRGRLKELYERL